MDKTHLSAKVWLSQCYGGREGRGTTVPGFHQQRSIQLDTSHGSIPMVLFKKHKVLERATQIQMQLWQGCVTPGPRFGGQEAQGAMRS